ncbi:DnaA N-terminal domain-containing protein [Pseudoponticoccus marisrubri]|uniref:DnaA N-terminal domain-containing protein n=1 Tax=Pseudoponticoccus marisrubri TaxID=1685382 RepID=A0A0W7WHC4_9RHOB|nr:DnaA N-terminal domain-containing protein [Pseudoponticoccus marisrubri]KUF09879.1 hypothetical protein AVJ23_15680 [Pseudoponticoccus marisrubri]
MTDARRFTGPQAGSQKYDLLTAISVAGLNGSPGFQTSMMRLVALVTARYNWARDELTVGQREMARLWSVDERTVKREIKRLTTAQILLQLRPGVRGRVAAYRLNVAEIHRLSAPVWERVGPDYSDRMARQAPAAPETPPRVVHVDFAAPRPETPATPTETRADPWARTLARLEQLEPALHRSWFAALRMAGCEGGVLQLRAPSRFQAQYVQTHHLRLLTGTAQLEFPGLRRVEIGV